MVPMCVVRGDKSMNTTSLICRFDSFAVPGTLIHSTEIHCSAPPMDDDALGRVQMTGSYPQDSGASCFIRGVQQWS